MVLYVGAALFDEKHGVGEGLEGVVDFVGELVGEDGAGLIANLVSKSSLVGLVFDDDGDEICEGVEQFVVGEIEGVSAFVGDGPDGSTHVAGCPGNKHAVGDGIGDEAEQAVEGRGDAEQLGAAGVDADAAGAGDAWDDSVEVGGEATGDGDPAESTFAVGSVSSRLTPALAAPQNSTAMSTSA